MNPAPPYYESEQGLAEYLLFHYGSAGEILPYSDGPHQALDFPTRCVSECLDPAALPPGARALDVGCAVGRSSFELARHCEEVIGLDFSERFIEAARQLATHGELAYSIVQEGRLSIPAVARVPREIPRKRVRFQHGDAQSLPAGLGRFDVVVLANLIDRLPDPRRCLDQLPDLLNPDAQLIITSPYTWLTEYTPVQQWLGGFERDGRPIRTLDALRELLAPAFVLKEARDLPFLIREHARKFQWSVAQATLWRRKP